MAAYPSRLPVARLWLVPLALLLLLAAGAARAGAEEVRAEFRAAFEAPGGGVASADSEALRAYPLYPWLQARRLRLRLPEANAALDSLIAEFLDRHGSAPFTQPLRGAWWRSLAERERWADYLAALGSRPDNDALLCQWLQARMALDRMEGFADDALAAWRRGRSMPGACDMAFDWLDSEGLLTEEAITERLRLALDAGELNLARYLTEQLPEAKQRRWTNARLARAQRGRFLRRLVDNPDAPIPFVDLEAGLHAHARRDPRDAAELLAALIEARDLPEDEAAALTRAVALVASWSREPVALELFETLSLQGHAPLHFSWHARAAMWARDWAALERVIAAMPASQAEDARWRYWAARARQLQGADVESAGYQALADERSYHGFLAAERLGREPAMDHQPLKRDAEAQRRLARLSGVQRAREWHALEEDARASNALEWALGELDDAGKAQAALMLADRGWHRQAISWLARAGEWDDLVLRFPTPYAAAFEAAVADAAISKTWLRAIVRTESLYDARAVSGAGARGLAQLMPATARRVASRRGLAVPDRSALFEADTNLVLAAHFVEGLQERFDGRWIKTLAAYNAGPLRIPGWLPEGLPTEADAWIENIPFNETRGYVQRALYHYLIIHWRATGEPGRILPLLAEPVEPAGVCC